MIFKEVIVLNKLLKDGEVVTARNTEYRKGQITYVKTTKDVARQLFRSLAGLKEDSKGRIIVGRAEVIDVYPATEENFYRYADDSGFDAHTWMELAKRYGDVKYIYRIRLIKTYAKPNNGKILTLFDFV